MSILVVVCVLACDPGFRLYPVGWAATDGKYEFQLEDPSGLVVETCALSMLEGASYISAEFHFHNSSDQEYSLMEAQLAGREERLVDVQDMPYEERKLFPGQSALFLFHWNIDLPAKQFLGENPQISLVLESDAGRKVLPVRYGKSLR